MSISQEIEIDSKEQKQHNSQQNNSPGKVFCREAVANDQIRGSLSS